MVLSSRKRSLPLFSSFIHAHRYMYTCCCSPHGRNRTRPRPIRRPPVRRTIIPIVGIVSVVVFLCGATLSFHLRLAVLFDTSSSITHGTFMPPRVYANETIASHSRVQDKAPQVKAHRLKYDTTLVIAHYKEWISNQGSDATITLPPWADPENAPRNVRYRRRYNVHPIVQRIDSTAPRYVPNNGYELGAYMKYIVDNYDNLPELVVFVQADGCNKNMEQVMEQISPNLVRSVGGYMHINCGYVVNRTFALWGDSVRNRTEECHRQVASEFGREDIFDGVPYFYQREEEQEKLFRLSFICCACYAVTRERIQQAASYETYRAFFNRAIERGECVPGRKDLDKGRAESAAAWEHLAHVIFGGYDAHWTEPVCLAKVLRPSIELSRASDSHLRWKSS